MSHAQQPPTGSNDEAGQLIEQLVDSSTNDVRSYEGTVIESRAPALKKLTKLCGSYLGPTDDKSDGLINSRDSSEVTGFYRPFKKYVNWLTGNDVETRKDPTGLRCKMTR